MHPHIITYPPNQSLAHGRRHRQDDEHEKLEEPNGCSEHARTR